jgi:hypothetical protein
VDLTTFRRNILPSYSALKMEAIWSTETLVSAYKSTRCYNAEDQRRNLHCRENLNIWLYLLLPVYSWTIRCTDGKLGLLFWGRIIRQKIFKTNYGDNILLWHITS